MKKLYVGNLPFETTQENLQEVFERFGSVASAAVIMDRDTGRSRGFGFIEMEDAAAADEAIKSLDGSDSRAVACESTKRTTAVAVAAVAAAAAAAAAATSI